MVLTIGEDEEVGQFVARLSPIEQPLWPTGFVGFGVRREGALVGGVVFSDWRKDFRTLQLSAAATDRRVFGPQILGSLGEYVFGQLEVFRLWARTSTGNKRARIFLRGLGFKPESTEAHWYGENRHSIQYRLTAKEWHGRRASPLREAA